MNKWTDEEITKWAENTFGRNEVLQISVRMNKEMAELLSALANQKLVEAYDELADLRVFLAQLHVRLAQTLAINETLDGATSRKMTVNQKRKWMIAKDGSHQHVEEEA